MPEGSLKRQIGRTAAFVPWLAPQQSFTPAMVAELEKLRVRSAVPDPEMPVLVLENGVTFHGFPPTDPERERYQRLPERLRRDVPEACIRVAIDIVCRYRYPQQDASVAAPYSRAERRAFRAHGRDRICDIPGLEPELQRYLEDQFRIDPGDGIVDCGSYIGFELMRLSELVGPMGRIAGFEPFPAALDRLRRNLAVNGIGNVEVVPRAVWSTPSVELSFHMSDFQANSVVPGIIRSKQAIAVQTDSIDSVVERLAIPRVTLISLTVNGAEIEALRGAQRTIAAHSPRLLIAGLYEVEGRPVNVQARELLEESGYRTAIGSTGRVYAWNPDIPRPSDGPEPRPA